MYVSLNKSFLINKPIIIMQVTTFENGVKNVYNIETAPKTFAELQVELRNQGVHTNWEEKTVEMRPGKVQLVPVSEIPDTNIILFLFPVDTKGGVTRKELEATAKAASQSSATGKEHFRGYTSMRTNDLIAKVDSWERLNAKPTKEKKVKAEKVLSTVPVGTAVTINTDNATVSSDDAEMTKFIAESPEVIQTIINVDNIKEEITESVVDSALEYLNLSNVVLSKTSIPDYKKGILEFIANGNQLPVDTEAEENARLQSEYNESKKYFGGNLKRRK